MEYFMYSLIFNLNICYHNCNQKGFSFKRPNSRSDVKELNISVYR